MPSSPQELLSAAERVTADYQLDSEVTQSRAFEAIESAKVIFKTLA